MKICLISREYPPDTGWGGIGTFTHHLAKGLIDIGHEVDVVSLAKNKAGYTLDGKIRIHRVKPYLQDADLGLLARAMPYTRYVISTSAALWRQCLALHQERPFDVIDTPELLAEGFFPAISKIAPLVIRLYTPHSKFIAEKLHNVSPSFDHETVAMVERIAMLYADAITSPSKDLAQYVAYDLNLPLEKITLIANPIDASVFSPVGVKAIEKPDQLKVLFIGRLEGRKGIKYLIEAVPTVLNQVPDVHFYIVGDDTKTAQGQTSVLAELQQFISQAKCQASVTFIDRLPLTELPAYYRSADVCVVPSLYDNSPYACLEAMSCGKPVIGTTSGGTKEYLVDGESGLLVEPKNAEAIAAALIRLLTDANERNRIGDNARQRVLDKYQRAEIARQTAALYERATFSYQTIKPKPVYTKPVRDILSDTDKLTASLNAMLHELLWHWSIRYRLANFIHSLKTRPRYFIAENLLKAVKTFMPNIDKSNGVISAPIRWLERQVILKQDQIVQSTKVETAISSTTLK